MSKSPDLESIFAYAERCLERDAAIEEAGAAPKDALWEHQVAAIEAINATLGEGVKRIVLQVPTGGGKLVPFTVLAPPGADLSQVRTIAGDFNEADLSLTCDTQKLVANIVTTWRYCLRVCRWRNSDVRS